ncbi:MAG: T9SS C-terminal target domain-containing protein, partial [Bacteroidota bacterium]
MKKYFYSLLLVFCAIAAFAQTPALQWQKSLGGSGTDEARSVYQTSDGGSIIAGNTNSTNGDVLGNHGSYDYWLVKIDAAGTVQWKKTYGGTTSDKGYAVIQLSYGGYLAVGNASSTDGDVTGNHGSSDYWIIRLNSAGTILWQKSLGGTSTDVARGVIQTLDGKLMVIGYSRSSNGNVTNAHGGYDFWLTKLDTSGNLIWQKTYGGTKDELAYTVKQASDSSFLIVGYTLSNDGDISGQNHSAKNDIWVVKTDKTGTLLWQKTLGGNSNDYSNSFIQTNDKGYLIIGYTESYDGDV